MITCTSAWTLAECSKRRYGGSMKPPAALCLLLLMACRSAAPAADSAPAGGSDAGTDGADATDATDGADATDGSDSGQDSGQRPNPYADDPYALVDSTLILVSLDGFRHDYMERAETPNLDRIANEGLRVERLVAAFPTKTFPNHYTLATGLWPEHHGIVDNSFYAPDLGTTFSMSDAGDNRDPRFFGGEPIWITAERQGVPAGTMFWVGSEVVWPSGIQQTWAVPYDGSISYDARVDRVLYWLDQPTDAPRMLTLYFDEPDHAGHSYGPDDAHVTAAIEEVDAAVGRLIAGLEARGRLDQTDLVVVSDHGMTAIATERALYVDEVLDLDLVWIQSWGAWSNIWPRDEAHTDAILRGLRYLPHATCARREDLPEHLHFSSGERVAPLHCIADLGYTLTSSDWSDSIPDALTGGTHGYDSAETDMHGILLARGPHIQAGSRLAPVENVNVYSLLARLIEVEPAANDGSLAPWTEALRPR